MRYTALSALHCLQKNIPLDDENLVLQGLSDLDIKFILDNDNIEYYLKNTNVSQLIRNEKIGMAASKIAQYGDIRTKLVAVQRSFAIEPGLVADGRDMGTVIFPHANYKIFLDASSEIRAQRRLDELTKKNISVSFNKLLKDIQQRDAQDTNREFSPLAVAKDAFVLDTSTLTVNEVFKAIKLWMD